MKPKTNPLIFTSLLAVTTLIACFQQVFGAINTYQWNGTTNSSWSTGTNWSASPGVGVTGGSSDSRLNVYNGAGQPLVYSVAQGTTVFANTSGRGMVISSASGVMAGNMEITGGSFSTFGSTLSDIIGNAATGILTVSGGSFIGASASAGGTILGLNSGNWVSTLNVSGTGNATVTRLQLSAGTTTVNLDGGTLTANEIVDVDNSGVAGNSNTTFNFNGGTLTAGADAVPSFMTGLTNAYVKSGGAKIDTNGKDITIGQALLAPVSGLSGGLDKSGSGTLTLSNTNTYTGATNITGGKLVVNGNISTSSLTTVESSGSLGGSGTVGTTTVNGALAPGNAIGSLNFSGSLILAGTANFEIDPTNGLGLNRSSDLANVSGAITYGGILNVLYGGSASDFTQGMVFNLFDGSSFSGSFSSLNLPSLTGGLSWQDNLATNGSLSVVPEPNAIFLGALGMFALLRRRR